MNLVVAIRRAAVIAVLLLVPDHLAIASAAEQAVVVTVNDEPITTFDIEQRVRLWQVLDQRKGSDRKKALQSLIDDTIKISAAKKRGLEAKEDMVNKQLERMAQNMGTDMKGLAERMKKQGVSISAVRQYTMAQLSFSRLLVAVYQLDIKVDPKEVDAAYQKIASDPRLKPVTAYTVMEIILPLEKGDESMQQQLVYARAAEAEQIKQRFRGCNSAREASSGVYNVQIKKPFEVDASKIPPPLKQAMDKAGPGHLVGPGMQGSALQLIGLCGRRVVAPPKPTRDAVENMITNQKYDAYEERYIRELRRTAFIDYKDKAYSQ